MVKRLSTQEFADLLERDPDAAFKHALDFSTEARKLTPEQERATQEMKRDLARK